MFGLDLGLILIWAAAIMLVFMLLWLVIVPLKLFNKLLLNLVLGIVCVFAYNIFAYFTKIEVIGINALSVAILVVLGIPGFLALVTLRLTI
jgi:inhibitor of the pro-sigma K processing machinery